MAAKLLAPRDRAAQLAALYEDGMRQPPPLAAQPSSSSSSFTSSFIQRRTSIATFFDSVEDLTQFLQRGHVECTMWPPKEMYRLYNDLNRGHCRLLDLSRRPDLAQEGCSLVIQQTTVVRVKLWSAYPGGMLLLEEKKGAPTRFLASKLNPTTQDAVSVGLAELEKHGFDRADLEVLGFDGPDAAPELKDSKHYATLTTSYTYVYLNVILRERSQRGNSDSSGGGGGRAAAAAAAVADESKSGGGGDKGEEGKKSPPRSAPTEPLPRPSSQPPPPRSTPLPDIPDCVWLSRKDAEARLFDRTQNGRQVAGPATKRTRKRWGKVRTGVVALQLSRQARKSAGAGATTADGTAGRIPGATVGGGGKTNAGHGDDGSSGRGSTTVDSNVDLDTLHSILEVHGVNATRIGKSPLNRLHEHLIKGECMMVRYSPASLVHPMARLEASVGLNTPFPASPGFARSESAGSNSSSSSGGGGGSSSGARSAAGGEKHANLMVVEHQALVTVVADNDGVGGGGGGDGDGGDMVLLQTHCTHHCSSNKGETKGDEIEQVASGPLRFAIPFLRHRRQEWRRLSFAGSDGHVAHRRASMAPKKSSDASDRHALEEVEAPWQAVRRGIASRFAQVNGASFDATRVIALEIGEPRVEVKAHDVYSNVMLRRIIHPFRVQIEELPVGPFSSHQAAYTPAGGDHRVDLTHHWVWSRPWTVGRGLLTSARLYVEHQSASSAEDLVDPFFDQVLRDYLNQAVRQGDEEATSFLLKQEAFARIDILQDAFLSGRLRRVPAEPQTLLYTASLAEHYKITSMLIDHVLDADNSVHCEKTREEKQAVRTLKSDVHAGYAVDAVDPHGNTLLQYAINAKSINLIRRLGRRSANALSCCMFCAAERGPAVLNEVFRRYFKQLVLLYARPPKKQAKGGLTGLLEKGFGDGTHPSGCGHSLPFRVGRGDQVAVTAPSVFASDILVHVLEQRSQAPSPEACKGFLEVVLLEADPTSHLLEPYIERFVEVLRAWAVQQQEDEAEAMLKHSSSSGSGVDTDTPAEARGRYELELFLEDAVFKLHSALVIARVCQKKQNADPTNRRFFARLSTTATAAALCRMDTMSHAGDNPDNPLNEDSGYAPCSGIRQPCACMSGHRSPFQIAVATPPNLQVVAHPCFQVLVEERFGRRRYGSAKEAVSKGLYLWSVFLLLLPVVLVLGPFAPPRARTFMEKIGTPMTRLTLNALSEITFIVLVLVSLILARDDKYCAEALDPHQTRLEVALLIWSGSRFIASTQQVIGARCCGLRSATAYGLWDVAEGALFLTAGLLRAIATMEGIGADTCFYAEYWSDNILAVASGMLLVQFSLILEISERFGPMIHVLRRMRGDIGTFLVLLAGVILIFFFILLSVFRGSGQGVAGFESPEETLRFLLWSIFDPVRHPLTPPAWKPVEVSFFVFLFLYVAFVVFMNLFIAMMTKT